MHWTHTSRCVPVSTCSLPHPHKRTRTLTLSHLPLSPPLPPSLPVSPSPSLLPTYPHSFQARSDSSRTAARHSVCAMSHRAGLHSSAARSTTAVPSVLASRWALVCVCGRARGECWVLAHRWLFAIWLRGSSPYGCVALRPMAACAHLHTHRRIACVSLQTCALVICPPAPPRPHQIWRSPREGLTPPCRCGGSFAAPRRPPTACASA